jgi:hypothetical protein
MPRSRTAFLASLASTVAACAALAAIPACSDRPGSDVAVAGAGATWRWRAVNMEVAGLTTPMLPNAQRGPMLDVRISFFDSERDETKALGALSVSVLLDGREVGSQHVDLGTLEAHQHAWDGITETYALPTALSTEPGPGRVLVVHATFEGVDGSRMSASREVRWPERPR